MLIPYHHHLVDTGYLCQSWHIMDVDPLSSSLINIHYMSCVTQISHINQVMVIGDQHPLYVMCDTDIPYQPSDGENTWHIMDVDPYHHHLVDTGYLCQLWHIMDVDSLSSSLGWYGISVSHMTYNGCWSPIIITWLNMPCFTHLSLSTKWWW
jgi:hypothetical protein